MSGAPLDFAAIVDGVRAVFLEEAIPAAVLVGERELAKQGTQGPRGNRVVIIPTGGDYEAPRFPGSNPRPVADLVLSSEVHVWGFDVTAPNDELRQYAAALRLHDALIVALRRVAHGQARWSGATFTREPAERMAGKELTFTLTTRHPVVEVEWPEVSGVAGQAPVVLGLPGGDVPVC